MAGRRVFSSSKSRRTWKERWWVHPAWQCLRASAAGTLVFFYDLWCEYQCVAAEKGMHIRTARIHIHIYVHKYTHTSLSRARALSLARSLAPHGREEKGREGGREEGGIPRMLYFFVAVLDPTSTCPPLSQIRRATAGAEAVVCGGGAAGA